MLGELMPGLEFSISVLLKRRDQRAGGPMARGRRIGPRRGVSSGGLGRAGPLRCVETGTAELKHPSGGETNEKEKHRFIWIKTHPRGSVEARSSLAGGEPAGRTGDIGYSAAAAPPPHGLSRAAAEVG